MEKQHKFSIWYVLIAVWIVLIIQNLIIQTFSVERIPYSAFIKALETGKISEVAITPDQIQGKIKTNEKGKDVEKTFVTVRVDADLSELLDKYHVTFKGVIESHFLRNLASWILPLFLFFGIWYFMMRRFAAQQGSFLTLGKKTLAAERQFNKAAGFTAADDRLPDFFKNDKLPPHGVTFAVPDEDLDKVFDFVE